MNTLYVLTQTISSYLIVLRRFEKWCKINETK